MLRDEKKRRIYFKLMDRKLTVKTKWFKNIVVDYFEGQKKRLLEGLGVKALKADLHVFNQELEIKVAFDKFYPALLEVMKEAGEDAMKTDFDFSLSGSIRSWLDERVRIFSTQINETTFKELKNQFEESTIANETREQLVKRIEETYGDIKKYRAETIARTEVHGTMQKGTIEGYEQSGMRVKIWVSVIDSKTRDAHAGMDGEEVSINSAFSNGLMFPSDPSGPPEEVINCRCTI
jgi:SPP1 gp7 family putative phage head morphogenesis protein